MRKRLAAKPHLSRQLIPNFAFGCRRPTPGNGYLEALASDNVEAIFTPIAMITSSGIQTTDNVEHKLDAIVCATGFDVSFKPRFPLYGRGGENLQDRWTRETPKSYMSLMIAGFPNYFSLSLPLLTILIQMATNSSIQLHWDHILLLATAL
jgi:cation diffusion facilitator CzcD-associated flavoprotein CzcO